MRRTAAAALIVSVAILTLALGAALGPVSAPGSLAKGATLSPVAAPGPATKGAALGPPAAPGLALSAGSDGGTVFGAGEEPFGCTSIPNALVREAPRSGTSSALAGEAPRPSTFPALPSDAVALTFDDGPSLIQTPAILETLVRFGARATFFEEGRHVAGREALMRQILAAGDEIGNHSFHHPVDPGAAELSATNAAIHAATGFTPCLFRPPYGEVDGKVERAARANGLEIVLWTLDSEDDHHRDPAAIRRRVVTGAEPGSIVLLHDGGHHPQTVRALPGIVAGLEARGLRLVTVTELLGGRTLVRG